ncbi:MAG: Na(+)-translocating NADH-quinone reductase subunit C [Pseudomonadota bacterium]
MPDEKTPELPQSNPDAPEGSDAVAAKPKGLIGRFLALPPDSVPKTIFTAVSLCIVASMVVSSAAVALRPTQAENARRDKQINILQVSGVYDPDVPIQEAFAAFEPHVLELDSGFFADDQFDPATFDDRAAAEDPELSIALEDDPASIIRQSRFMTVYLLRDEAGDIDRVILPIHGYGLWSTLYGFVAIEENGNDIFGLQFYQHAETPGLGAEVDNPRWRAQWNGKQISDETGTMQITVARVPPAAGAEYHVDSLSGATLTSRGVDNLVRFWLGEEGYAPFLTNLANGEI